MGSKITKKGCELESESQKVFLATTSIIAARITFGSIDKILNAANFFDRMTCENQVDILQKMRNNRNLYFQIGSFFRKHLSPSANSQ